MKTKTLTALKLELENVITSLDVIGENNEFDSVENKILSTLNLNQYFALRQLDLTNLQKKLKKLGISRLARSESHVMHSLHLAHILISGLLKSSDKLKLNDYITITKAEKKLIKNTKQLLGRQTNNKRVRLMVTMPSEAADNYELVEQLVMEGMNCARINCAHDTIKEWKKMADNIRKAASKLNHKVLIAMDLGGPKIRTANFLPIDSIHRLMPKKDDHGTVVKPLELQFVKNKESIKDNHQLLTSKEFLKGIKVSDSIEIIDVRGKKRTLLVTSIIDEIVTVSCEKTLYIKAGVTLKHDNKTGDILAVAPKQAFHILYQGDILEIVDETFPLQENHKQIRCTFPQIIQHVKKGEKISFDDGKIVGIIEKVEKHSIRIKITKCKPEGTELKEDKGINLPDSNINIRGLTEKDKVDFKAVAQLADIVNFSFVNTTKDLDDLFELMDKHKANHLGVILKIETKTAYNNLNSLLNKTMTKDNAFGVMIARGDLAIEVGWENIGRVQTEVLRICSAAHTPIIWATQVLENLAKKGVPSRSEMTDINHALKAECIMLNKGPFMLDVMKILNDVLQRDEAFQHKNDAMLPTLEKL